MLQLDQNKFWKSIGKISINSNKNKSIPIETGKGCTVVSNPDDVLNKWKERFKKLYNDHHGLSCNNDYTDINILQRDRHVPEFSENISIFQIENAIKKKKIIKLVV